MYEKLFESIYRESKDRFINKLGFLTDEEKTYYRRLFKVHPELDSKIDWNKTDALTKEKLELIARKAENSNTKEKWLPRKMFTENKNDFEILLETERWFFVYVKTYEGAVFCNSAKCGQQKAMWCIGGGKNSNKDWIEHHERLCEDFVLAFDKLSKEPNKKKWMIAFGEKTYITDQLNNIDFNIQNEFNVSLDSLYDSIPRNYTVLNVPEGTELLIEKAIDKSICKIDIPNTVREIESKCFYGCKNLKSISLPHSVLKIGDFAFSNCFSLNDICMDDNLLEIGSFAFSGCKNLKYLEIPYSVEKIGKNAFPFDFEYLKLPSRFKNIDLGIQSYQMDSVIFY